jgi:quercetin dioxygenase-like cupin family protein
MSEHSPAPVVKRDDDIDYESVENVDGLSKGVLLGESDGTPAFTLRRFTIDPGTEVAPHTNAVEHQQYVLDGEFVVGIDDEEYTVTPGDSVFIPEGVVHWYRNESDEPGAFICGVSNGDDTIELAETEG